MSVTRMTSRFYGAAIVALLLAGPGVAWATVHTGTFTGIVTDGIDETNNFGFGANADLTGLTVTGDFYYDTSGGYAVGSELGTSGVIFPPVIFAEVFVGGSVNPVATFSDDNGDVDFTNNNLFVLQGDDYDSGFSDSVTLEVGTGAPAFAGSGLNQGFNLINPAIGYGSFYETIGTSVDQQRKPISPLRQRFYTMSRSQRPSRYWRPA
jgi:hypothetical protein